MLNQSVIFFNSGSSHSNQASEKNQVINLNPQGKWQRVELRLHSELDDEDTPMVKWSERIDRRLTIEPEPAMWAEITNAVHNKKPQPSDGTVVSEVYVSYEIILYCCWGCLVVLFGIVQLFVLTLLQICR